jgi:hypothetical protein
MDEEGPDIPGRAGNFFIVLGLGLIFLFIISDMYNFFSLGYFFGAALTLALGVFLKLVRRREPKPSERFHGIRKMMAKGKTKPGKDNKKK